MSNRPRKYHKWSPEELSWIEENADRETVKSIARRFNVSERAVRDLIKQKFPVDVGDQFRQREKGNLRQAEIICPYYTSTISSGIKCDGRFIRITARTRVRSHVLNHCCKYYSEENGEHCEMRRMLNHIWEMKV